MARSRQAARYRTITELLWNATEWTGLPATPPSARCLVLFLAVGPLQKRVPGVVLVGEGELSDRLGWPLAALRKCMREAETAGSCEFDRGARFVWLPWRFSHEPPSSPDVVRGWRQEIEQWPRCELAAKALRELLTKLAEKGPGFAAALSDPPDPETIPTLQGDPPPPASPATPGGHQRSREAEKQRSNESAPPAIAETGIRREQLMRLLPALAIRDELDPRAQQLVARMSQYPAAQVRAGVEAYIERKEAPGEHDFSYVVAMVSRGATPTAARQAGRARSVTSH